VKKHVSSTAYAPAAPQKSPRLPTPRDHASHSTKQSPIFPRLRPRPPGGPPRTLAGNLQRPGKVRSTIALTPTSTSPRLPPSTDARRSPLHRLPTPRCLRFSLIDSRRHLVFSLESFNTRPCKRSQLRRRPDSFAVPPSLAVPRRSRVRLHVLALLLLLPIVIHSLFLDKCVIVPFLPLAILSVVWIIRLCSRPSPSRRPHRASLRFDPSSPATRVSGTTRRCVPRRPAWSLIASTKDARKIL